jgi:hypothetical protein
VVPRRYPENLQLSDWYYSIKKLLRDQTKRRPLEQWQLIELASIGLTPKSVRYTHPEKSWNNRYKELKAFYDEFGHCYVPERIAGDLGRWLTNVKSQQCGR